MGTVEALILRQQLKQFLYDCNEVSPEALDKLRALADSNSLYFSVFQFGSSFPTLWNCFSWSQYSVFNYD